MFKIGDIVVRIDETSPKDRVGTKNGDIWKVTKIISFDLNAAYLKDEKSWTKVRKATNNEIKWFEAGITNINQIPEVGGTYLNGACNNRTITGINYTHCRIVCGLAGVGPTFTAFLKSYSKTYKPPIKSTVDRDVMFGKPFEIGDLKNCKIGNLTPEDHKIIQPWLFSLGYKWISGNKKVQYTEVFGLGVSINNKVFKMNNEKDFFIRDSTTIKKELILNYIKQLNTNNNYEQINKRTKIKPESSTIRGASIRIPVITGRIASASRLIGNKASGKCVKSQIRKFEIVANIITC
jgi:hypothetical protein